MNSSFITLNEHLGRFNDILNTISILIWDSRTKMPKEGAQTRGMQIGTQTLIARDLLLSSKLRKLLETAPQGSRQLQRSFSKDCLSKMNELFFHAVFTAETDF